MTDEDYAPDVNDLQDRTAKRWEARLDERLEYLPSVITLPENDLWIEWYYIIDLDHETFEVGSGGYNITYRLSEVPEIGIEQWHKDLKDGSEEGADDEGDEESKGKEENEVTKEEVIQEEVTREEATKEEVTKEEVTEEEEGHKEVMEGAEKAEAHKGGNNRRLPDEGTLDHSLLAVYKELKRTQVAAKQNIDLDSAYSHDHILRAILFADFWKFYDIRRLAEELNWCTSDFGFREVAFVIICLASGTFGLQAQTDLEGHLDEGYCWKAEPNKGHQILPAFAKGYHAPGVEPGSAPKDTIYWFKNVVICLDESLDPDDDFDVAIARAVGFGRDAGRVMFDGLIVSLANVVLFRYDWKAGVKFSARIPYAASEAPQTPPPEPPSIIVQALSTIGNEGKQKKDKAEAPLTKKLNSAGFNAMIHLFDGAALQQLKPSPVNTAKLPLEVCHMILELVDDTTYHTCSYVSRSFRAYTQKNLRLGGHVIRKYIAPSTFKISDTVTDTDISSTPETVWYRHDSDRMAKVSTPTWFPILSDTSSESQSRLTILENNGLLFRGLSPPPLPTARRPRTHLLRNRELTDPYMFGDPGHSLGRFTTARQTCDAWDRLLGRICGFGQNCQVRTEAHLFKLPPNTHVISVHKLARAASSSSRFNTAAVLWVRKPADLEVQGKYELALRDAREHLQREFAEDEMLVGVVFGHWVRYFDWVLAEGQGKLVERDGGKMYKVADDEEREQALKVFRDIAESAQKSRDLALLGDRAVQDGLDH